MSLELTLQFAFVGQLLHSSFGRFAPNLNHTINYKTFFISDEKQFEFRSLHSLFTTKRRERMFTSKTWTPKKRVYRKKFHRKTHKAIMTEGEVALIRVSSQGATVKAAEATQRKIGMKLRFMFIKKSLCCLAGSLILIYNLPGITHIGCFGFPHVLFRIQIHWLKGLCSYIVINPFVI